MHDLHGSQERQQDSVSPAVAGREPQLRAILWCVALSLGLLHFWARRNEVSPDSISYIEIAWRTARFGWHEIVNAYWSPLYPFLLSPIFRCFHPAVQWEFTAAHLLNFAIYVASIASFELFLKELILLRQTAGEGVEKSSPVGARTVRIWGYVFFLWASYFWLGTEWVTPDLCVAVTVYLATALLFRIWRGRGNWLVFAGAGALLGLGYLAKSAMFPVAFVFLFSAFWLARDAGASFRAATLRTFLAAAVFAGFALPLVLALSAAKGRPTFGDVGGISYVEFVNRATRSVHWQGQPAETGTPTHPTRKLFSDPATFEFSSPVQGSYPPWYDPSYWYDGARPRFRVKDQLWALFRAANVYLKIFSKSGALWVVLVALLVVRKKALAWGSFAASAWLVILPSMAALAMYSLVLVEFRYTAPFALVWMMWMLARMRILSAAKPRLLMRFHVVMILAPSVAVAGAVTVDLFKVIVNKPYEPWVVAQQLHAMGIAPGTDVGFIGIGLQAYWAHLAGVRIIVEIPEVEQWRFVGADAARRQQVLALLTSAGAKAVITKNAEVAKSAEGWRQIPGTQHYIWQQPWLIAAPERK